jgi:pimeloyl-ACP methyl ester carboxylesterase
MPYLAASGTNLFYSDWGRGAPVVFVHAWGLSSAQWDYQIPDLVAAGRRCVTFDKRGHGRSDRSPTGYDHDGHAADIAAVLEHLDLTDVTVVAHSFGCGNAVRYLTRYGDGRVSALALVAPSTPLLVRTPDNPDGVDPAFVDANLLLLQQDVPNWCALNAPPYFGSAQVSDGLIEWTTREIIGTPLPILLESARANALTDLRGELAALRVPTLIVHGDADASAPIELTGRKTAALVPDCTLVVYEGAGHGLYASDHDRLNTDLLAFIEQHQRQPA